MKALVITSKSDFRVHSLIAPLRSLMEVGLLQKHDHQAVSEFNADLIFSDEPEKSPNGYDLNRIGSIRPFIDLMSYSEPSACPKYESDISYIGPISDMESSLLDMYRLGYNVRNFYGSPSLLPCYSGSVQVGECWSIYRSAKVSPVPKSDIGYRELDIIAAGGNPLRFTSKEEFISEAIKGIKGKKFKHIVSKSQIFFNNTNFDRLAQIINGLGFSAVAKRVLEDKKCLV